MVSIFNTITLQLATRTAVVVAKYLTIYFTAFIGYYLTRLAFSSFTII